MPALPELHPHSISVALLQPQIAPNTGNIGRLCVATGTHLHVVRPMGFVLSDQNLRRSAMDYWPRLKLTIHDDTESFLASIRSRLWLFTIKGGRSIWDAHFLDGDCLVFGSETHGLPGDLLDRYPESCVRIPQIGGERCLNVSTAAGVGLYEALRRIRS
ncbi:MAG TPA: tRNA (cytidine(34)-2'-O)-methyltransferase [Tepidisphaeraceae bacterium]|nr:tRNA (cytidine(34)-2'-O)-methyltransferase [Tepidisphaeraceae bacterium]